MRGAFQWVLGQIATVPACLLLVVSVPGCKKSFGFDALAVYIEFGLGYGFLYALMIGNVCHSWPQLFLEHLH